MNKGEWVRLNTCKFCIGSHLHTCSGYDCRTAAKEAEEYFDKMEAMEKKRRGGSRTMNKTALKALFINAKSVGARYIGMRLTQTGIEKPEFHITQRENFDKMFEYFMKMYDDDLISLTNREIKITGIAQGNTFEDIEFQLCDVGVDWKQPISDAIEKSYNNMISETPPASEEERLRCEAMKEAVKGMFLNESRTAAEARFIFDNLEKYEELFDVCMNGDDIEFKRGLIELQRLQNEYILREEKDE